MNWPITRHVERRARRLHDVMRRLDVDPVQLIRLDAGQSYAQARTRCLECRRAERCLAWLDTPAGAAPEFCPNLELFTSVKKSAKSVT